jgi:hypothetical protein
MIIDDGNIAVTKDFGINDHCALIEKMEAAGSVKEELSGDQLGNLADYFKSLPSEAAMKLWSVVGQVSEKNAIGLHGLSSDFLIKMLAGDNS